METIHKRSKKSTDDINMHPALRSPLLHPSHGIEAHKQKVRHIRGVYMSLKLDVAEAYATETRWNISPRGIFQSVMCLRRYTAETSRNTPLPLISQMNLLNKIVCISLGMINVTSLSYVNSRSEKLIPRPPRKRLMDAHEQAPHTVG